MSAKRQSGSEIKTVAAIPAYNESKNIESIIKRTYKYVDQVIVLDDGSVDGTDKIAEAAGAMVVRHVSNQGKGVAISNVFRIARSIQPQALVLLDGDGQHNPEEITLLIDPVLNRQIDMVVGSRFLRNNKIPVYRRLGLSVLTLTTNICSGLHCTDTQSGYRAFSKKSINAMTFHERGFAVESEMQFQAKQHNLRVLEVPITTNYDDKHKRNPVTHGVMVLIKVINLFVRLTFNNINNNKKNKNIDPQVSQVSGL